MLPVAVMIVACVLQDLGLVGKARAWVKPLVEWGLGRGAPPVPAHPGETVPRAQEALPGWRPWAHRAGALSTTSIKQAPAC